MTWRVDISERPAIADQKTEIGHWESDTMIGGNHLGVLVTHVDKAGSSLLFMLNQHTRCQDNILLTQKFRKFLKP